MVYDPNYVYSPWKRWVAAGIILLVVSLIVALAVGAQSQNNGTVSESEAASISTNSIEDEQIEEVEYYQVAKVIDGDTVDVKIGGKTERIRIIGLDTPETVDPRKTVECFGQEASQKAKSILEGASVRLEPDSTQDDRDKYGRLLRYIFLEDGTNFSKLMIAEGYGHEYTYNIPYKYQSEFKAAEKEARDNSRGLWSENACSNPDATSAPAAAASPAVVVPLSLEPAAASCDPNYSGGCVPLVGYDLNCPDIGFMVQVIGTDVHRFDRDQDGWGCESYG